MSRHAPHVEVLALDASSRTNPEIRKALLKKLGCSPQALSQRVKRLVKQLPVSTPLAVYVIAHDQGIRIDKHLGRETIAEVRQLVRDLRSTDASSSGGRRAAQSAAKTAKVVVRVAGAPEEEHAFLSKADAVSCKRMSELYPHVYLFENSVRRFIREVLEREFGTEWEDHIPSDVRSLAEGRRRQHGQNAWHSVQSADTLAYVDIAALTKIINMNSRHFGPLFNGVPNGYRWLTAKLDHIELHRNVIAHNNALSKDNAAELKQFCRQWQRQAERIEKILAEDAQAPTEK